MARRERAVSREQWQRDVWDSLCAVATAWPMKATNHPICKFEDRSKEWGRACAGRGTHQGEDGREEEEVVGEDWSEVVAFASAWRHFEEAVVGRKEGRRDRVGRRGGLG